MDDKLRERTKKLGHEDFELRVLLLKLLERIEALEDRFRIGALPSERS